MKKFALVLLSLVLVSNICYADYVRGYYRSNGTYVNGYNRTSPNNTRYDNYSTKGNYNPYTGQQGYKNPYPNNSYNNNYYNNYNRSRNNTYGY